MKDILIVDDERDIRELISEILIDEGYQTRLCGSADECLQELKKSVPGLLIPVSYTHLTLPTTPYV